MAVELPDVVDIGTIKLVPNEYFYYAAWGIKYRFSPEGKPRIAQMVFSRKSDAEVWMKEHFLNMPDVIAETVPIKRTLLMDEHGTVQRWIEELTEE